jgi:phenylalanyl-tRNA synthetase beta chain
MYVSLNWLKEFVNIPKNITPKELANTLTLKTAEVESVNVGGKGLEGVVIGELLEIRKHPQADKLNVSKVDIGKGKPIQVIFGAMVEMKVGYRVPVAIAPTTLPTGMEILKRSLRGELSEGMLCLDQELGFKDEGVSIQFFPKTVKPGTPLCEALNLNDTIIEIDNKALTHRPDLWGIYGIARDISAIYKTPFKELNPKPKIPTKGEQIKVDIHNYELCPRYTGVIIKNIKVQPSPEWMQKHLQSVGHKCYNNIVDVTNYISAELGQPLHAFDRHLIHSDKIIVRTANKGETIKTLDGKVQQLKEEMLLISDEKKAVAIAGVMGGENSEIQNDTTEIIIESATFNGANVRRTSTALGLRTEAVQRFEKQLDPHLSLFAMGRAIELILQVSPGAYVAGPITDNHKFDSKPRVVELSVKRAQSKIGIDISKAEIVDILKRLFFKVTEVKKSTTANSILKIEVPSFRAQKDISTEDDIIEEIARIYGYDKIPAVLPTLPTNLPRPNEERSTKHNARKFLSLGLGFDEIMTYSFYSKDDLTKSGLEESNHIKILNFLSEDQTHMRVSLTPNLLKKIDLNSKYLDDFKLFEIGRTYKDTGKYFPLEEKWIAGAIVTKDKKAGDKTFYEAKGAVDQLLKYLKIPFYKLAKCSHASYAHPVKSTEILSTKGETLGRIFILHPVVQKNFELQKLTCALFELNLTLLVKSEKRIPKFKELPKFPLIEIDISVVVDETLEIAEIENEILKADKQLIKAVKLFDFYKGENIEKGKKSVAFKVTLASDERTLTDGDMKEVQEKIFDNLKSIGGTIRGT